MAFGFAAAIAVADDYLQGGYVSSYDHSGMDPGIAGMVKWLDAPVYSFPWYSSDSSFYKQSVSSSLFTPYQEYYTTAASTTGASQTSTSDSQVVSSPVGSGTNAATPYSLYYGNGQAQTYSQYASASSDGNELWIQGATNWTRYAVVPVGASLQLIASVPEGGSGGFYKIIQSDKATTEYSLVDLNTGYNTMNFQADQIGRHMLYYVVGSQPSNVIIVDVFSMQG